VNIIAHSMGYIQHQLPYLLRIVDIN